jgi:hypothetical protein
MKTVGERLATGLRQCRLSWLRRLEAISSIELRRDSHQRGRQQI